MTTIAIPDHTYQRLAALAALRNLTPEDYVVGQLELLARQNDNDSTLGKTTSQESSRREWLHDFDAWIADLRAHPIAYPPGHSVDVSRESMYEGCGE